MSERSETMVGVEQQLGAAAALAGLPSMGPRRLTALLRDRPPAEAWALATSGRRSLLQQVLAVETDLTALTEAWSAAGRGIDPLHVLAAHTAAGVTVRVHPAARGRTPDGETGAGEEASDWPSYPDELADDLEPPAVLLTEGPLHHLDGPRVAIVGTRRCTGVGAGMARELGRELSAAGVQVVSGLALGIDGAAHRGVLDAMAGHDDAAPPIGVVGSGHDIVYPPRNRDLWRAVAERGLLVSEAPLGTRPAGWRFPARNRVIAALADVVVVVESHAAGGSLHTVQEAMARDIDVMAVPGSVRSAAAAGCNQLLAEGCHPVRDAGDVLVALGLHRARRRRPVEHRATPTPLAASVLEAFDWEPATLEHLAVRTGFALPELAVALEGLVSDGWVGADGGWYERRAAS